MQTNVQSRWKKKYLSGRVSNSQLWLRCSTINDEPCCMCSRNSLASKYQPNPTRWHCKLTTKPHKWTNVWPSLMLSGWTEIKLWTLRHGSKCMQKFNDLNFSDFTLKCFAISLMLKEMGKKKLRWKMSGATYIQLYTCQNN